MSARSLVPAALLLAVLAIVASRLPNSQADDSAILRNSEAGAPLRKFKPLSNITEHGLTYLVSQQNADGGWGQGGGWRQNNQGGGRVEGAQVQDPSDLGNTCIATLALIRAGSSPQNGPYSANVARAAAFIYKQVEGSDNDSLYVTSVRDTQLQSKIGQYVDTFLAGLVLSELKGQLPADVVDGRLLGALDKTVKKIEKNQASDGTFAGNTGWASVLSQGLFSKFVNRAAQNQVAVKDEVLRRDFEHSIAGLDKKTGRFSAAPAAVPAESALSARAGRGGERITGRSTVASSSDAGVQLYNSATNASRINDFGNTSAEVEKRANETLTNKTASVSDKKKARGELDRIAGVKEAQKAAVRGIVDSLGDKGFIAGFGNNGGEEFLSYMNISEMLAVQGGADWDRWDKSVAENLERVQNKDGSWAGQHCITGRTFCTSAALLTLMADRAPVPLAAQIKKAN